MTDATWVLKGTTLYGYDAGLDKLIVTDMEGVNDGPSLRDNSTPKPLGDGDFPAPSTRGSRLITARGWCEASTESSLLTLRNQVIGILDEDEVETFTINEFGAVRTAQVQLIGEQRFRLRGDPGSLYADWSFMLKSTNPRLFDAGDSVGHW
jgi:hypothetical protein